MAACTDDAASERQSVGPLAPQGVEVLPRVEDARLVFDDPAADDLLDEGD